MNIDELSSFVLLSGGTVTETNISYSLVKDEFTGADDDLIKQMYVDTLYEIVITSPSKKTIAGILCIKSKVKTKITSARLWLTDELGVKMISDVTEKQVIEAFMNENK